MIRVRRLPASEVAVVAAIDRSETVVVRYEVRDGQLVECPVTAATIPDWDRVGDGENSAASKIRFCEGHLAAGAVLFGAFTDADELAGTVIVDPDFAPPMAWLVWLHVSRPHRRQGAGRALWSEAVAVARDAGATSMYVSATPTGSAVGFYRSQGATLADPVHPALFAEEPEDIHLVAPL